MAAGRRAAEVMIKGDDPVHLGAGNIQNFGDEWLGRFIDIAELLLQGVEDRQQRSLAIEASANALQREFRVPGDLTSFHWHQGNDIRLFWLFRRLLRISNG
jgi:hypothetical protein